jgi:5-methylcytosine-specific restriction endonuclease McrA
VSSKGKPRRKRDRSMDSRVYHRAGWQCEMPECLCPDGRAIDRSIRGTNTMWSPTVDHIIPVAAGGADKLSNYRAAHQRCNDAAGNPGSVRLPPVSPPLTSTIGDLCPGLVELFTPQ